MRVLIGSDLKCSDFKNQIKEHLINKGFEVIDKTEEENYNFFQAATLVANGILNKEGVRAIVIDEYGTGSFNVCAKHKGIVCAQVADEHSAKMTRDHNNTSIITIGSKVTSLEIAKRICEKFILSEYSGGRHQIRVDMLNKMA
ncbi:galactose-6-phosphate isomerase [Clostridium baratii]|uniref:galactose-6-phosphate isomerase subunit LacA n=1 Tax=Clostridium baratii TaxID=1561 RepID=UPI0009A2D18C|nr:galactose-6-phosphate isomerase subunit LacA [Clostridium baratii]OPF51193.1 galactose-6-phosphate isomerase [Clostridium baratii]OPF55730.1 galactose-6-phosphate isomerase [Clostridium baratii]OPF56890.1 galactose-6-phosphate isomerase [Clostridium baratii]OPF59889.1 galactose-6-phosphate isomerase [Clostridium baratii]